MSSFSFDFSQTGIEICILHIIYIVLHIIISYNADFTQNMKIEQFKAEIDLLKTASKGDNPHVIKMVGCVSRTLPLSIIMEYAPGGSLLQCLRNARLQLCNEFKVSLIHLHGDPSLLLADIYCYRQDQTFTHQVKAQLTVTLLPNVEKMKITKNYRKENV